MKVFERFLRNASHRALGKLADDENYIFLREHKLFKNVSAEAFLFIMNRIIERRYNLNERIFSQGNPGICLFVVKQGSVEVFTEQDGDVIVPATVPEGGLFGEMSVISLSARTMAARAAKQGTILLALSKFDLDALTERHPRDAINMICGITDTIARNLVATTKKLESVSCELEQLTGTRDTDDS
jgi:CRP-like cAMP-binding protein